MLDHFPFQGPGILDGNTEFGYVDCSRLSLGFLLLLTFKSNTQISVHRGTSIVVGKGLLKVLSDAFILHNE